jgi:hypothetical protein
LGTICLCRARRRSFSSPTSCSVVIRDAIEAYLYDEENARIDREIREGYERFPETDEEMAAAEREARELIREEPW